MIALLKTLFNPTGLLIAGLVFLAGMTAGARVVLWKVGSDQADAAAAALVTQKTYARAADKVATNVAENKTRIEYRTKQIIKEVPVYVTTKANAGCAVTRGFVELFNASAADRLPKPAIDADDRATGVALADIGDAVTENHAAYYQCRATLEGWQSWCKGVNCLAE